MRTSFVRAGKVALLAACCAAWVGRAAAIRGRVAEASTGIPPYGISVDPDGFVYWAAGTHIGFSVAGVPTLINVVGATDLQAMARGVDAFWVVDTTGNKVWKVPFTGATPTAVVIPTSNSQPKGITIGPDGAVWFTEFNGGRIGRIDALGALYEYIIETFPPVPVWPLGIVTGSDRALWFTEYNNNKIGRLTTAYNLTEYPIPSASAYPVGIAASRDTIAFTEPGTNKIGVIALGFSTVHEYDIPTAGSTPQQIVWGQDYAFWFAEYNGGNIGRMTTSGTFTEYSIPTAGSQPRDITVGPLGGILVAESGIARFGTLSFLGDVNLDGHVDVNDVFYMINFLFAGGPAPE